MKYLLKQVTILDTQSAYHKQVVDILLEEGTIKQIAENIQKTGSEIINIEGAIVSVGWMDTGVQACDPGFEYREDLDSISNAAASGGFTALATYPNTHPVIHSKSEILYIKNKTNQSIIDFYPIGAVSRDCSGKDITEMYDMHHAGAIAFSDGVKSIQDSGVLIRALQYVKGFEGTVINIPYNESISPEGQMHEGFISTTLGMRGIPDIAEELMVQRDLQILKYTGSRLHLAYISTAGSVKLIREAKANGLKVTASVALNNLIFTDQALHEFDSNLKVLPPVRSMKDLDALKFGLRDGTIDFISTNHVPHVEDEKKLEFPYAAFGAIGLQTALGATLMVANGDEDLDLEQLVDCWARKSRTTFGLTVPSIKEGVEANLIVFHPELEWTVDPKSLLSKSKNSPFINQTIKGKVLAIFNNDTSEIYL